MSNLSDYSKNLILEDLKEKNMPSPCFYNINANVRTLVFNHELKDADKNDIETWNWRYQQVVFEIIRYLKEIDNE